MSKDEKCPLCGVTWTFVRDLQRRAEIGARAVELLTNIRDTHNLRAVSLQILADARAAGMVGP